MPQPSLDGFNFDSAQSSIQVNIVIIVPAPLLPVPPMHALPCMPLPCMPLMLRLGLHLPSGSCTSPRAQFGHAPPLRLRLGMHLLSGYGWNSTLHLPSGSGLACTSPHALAEPATPIMLMLRLSMHLPSTCTFLSSSGWACTLHLPSGSGSSWA